MKRPFTQEIAQSLIDLACRRADLRPGIHESHSWDMSLGRNSLRGTTAALILTVGMVAAQGLAAQLPTRAEADRLLQENPELVRQQLQQSGLSPQEIRARLRALGIPADQLDAFLGGGPLAPTAAVTPDVLNAMQALGMAVEIPDGTELVPLQTASSGAIRYGWRGWTRSPGYRSSVSTSSAAPPASSNRCSQARSRTRTGWDRATSSSWSSPARWSSPTSSR
jgi:hypothetical protein